MTKLLAPPELVYDSLKETPNAIVQYAHVQGYALTIKRTRTVGNKKGEVKGLELETVLQSDHKFRGMI